MDQELLTKAKAAETAEELLTLAKENGMELFSTSRPAVWTYCPATSSWTSCPIMLRMANTA